jgi:hypothetical protein
MFKTRKSGILTGSLLLICLIAAPFSTVSKAVSTPQPVQLTKSFSPGTQSGTGVLLFSVPNGKRLVIETITVRAALPAGEEPDLSELLTNTTSTGGGAAVVIHEMLVVRQGLDLNGRGVFAGTHPIRAYSEPNTFVFFQFGRSGNTSGAEMIVSLSGSLVDA